MWQLAVGFAWGIYSLHGKGAGDPVRVTAGNFLRAVPVAVALSVVKLSDATLDAPGIGYVIWCTALPALKVTHAATVQLRVPAIASLGGVIFLAEHISLRLAFATVAILGGIALVILEKQQAARE